MILDRDNEKASRYLSKFALMIRMTLNHSKDTFVTLDENIEYIKTYLDMEQLRFDDSFSYKILVAENIDTSEISIPSLMIQPLVENAIWHGLLPSEGDKKILIRFTVLGFYLFGALAGGYFFNLYEFAIFYFIPVILLTIMYYDISPLALHKLSRMFASGRKRQTAS